VVLVFFFFEGAGGGGVVFFFFFWGPGRGGFFFFFFGVVESRAGGLDVFFFFFFFFWRGDRDERLKRRFPFLHAGRDDASFFPSPFLLVFFETFYSSVRTIATSAIGLTLSFPFFGVKRIVDSLFLPPPPRDHKD